MILTFISQSNFGLITIILTTLGIILLITGRYSEKRKEKKRKYYTLFEFNEHNQIGIIACENSQELKTLIEYACEKLYNAKCTITDGQINKFLRLKDQNTTVTLEAVINDSVVTVEMAETVIYNKSDLEK